jgi:cholesterol transport system auxiliary component
MKQLSLMVLTVLMAACVTSHRPSTQYDLGEFTTARPQTRMLTAKLVIREVAPPSWLRTRNVYYRLDYLAPPHPQRYATSQWLATPGELVTVRLREAVAAANAGFTLSNSESADAYLLRTDLEEFIQAFSSPAESHCIVRMRVSLWHPVDQILAEREFLIDVPASHPDAGGAAYCLASAVNRETADIIGWLSEKLAGAD